MVESERNTLRAESVAAVEPYIDVQRHVWADPCNLLHQVTKVARNTKSHRIHDAEPVLLGNVKQAT